MTVALLDVECARCGDRDDRWLPLKCFWTWKWQEYGALTRCICGGPLFQVYPSPMQPPMVRG